MTNSGWADVPNTELPDDHPQRARAEDGSLSPRAPFPVREYPLSQTYVDVCLEGCLQYGTAFALRWLQAIRGCPTLEGQSAHG